MLEGGESGCSCEDFPFTTEVLAKVRELVLIALSVEFASASSPQQPRSAGGF